MNVSLFFLVLAAWIQVQVVPDKPKDEFEILVDFQFKHRNATNANTVEFVDTEARTQSSSSLRPYLILNLKFLKLSDQEVKVRAINNTNHTMFNKKAKENEPYKIVMGFTDDVKGRVTPHEVIITLSSIDKKETSQIHMTILESGAFMVNGELRGKF